MHFNSISSCGLNAVVIVSALNTGADDKHLYLPALNNFISVVVGGNVVAAISETRIVVPVGVMVEISLLAPSVNLATIFYEYAASNVSDGSEKSAGYFSITTKSQRDSLQVLPSGKFRKWYNYSTKSHNFVYYDQGAAYSITPSSGSFNLVVPLHVVPDPYTEKTYIYSANTGRLFSSVPTSKTGIKPFAYKKVVVTPDLLFTDLSSSQYTITGSVSKSLLSPAIGRYSAQFNGVNDYLITDSAVLDLSSQDFTIEFWIYPSVIPVVNMTNWANTQNIVTTLINDGVDTAIGFGVTDLFLVVDGALVLSAVHGFVKNTWTHVAISRKNNVLTIFINGTTVKSVYYAGSIIGGTATYIGTRAGINGYFKGHLTNIQVVRGKTLYTPSTYTVPTAAYVTSSDMLFSLGLASGSYVNGQSISTKLVDLKNRNTVIVTNNVTASTAVTKFGAQSFYFNDAGLQIVDLLVPTIKSKINSGNVTIEWWAYLENSILQQIGPHFGLDINFNNFSFLFDNQNYIVYADSINNSFFNTYSRGTTIYGSWNHYAIVKQSGLYKFYLNGALEFVGNYNSITSTPADTLYFGADASATRTFKGYIDGFVIKTSSNEIVNTFTPSTTLTVNSNAVLAIDFATVSGQSLSSATRIENYVFILTSDGTVTKVRVDNSTVASPKLPSAQPGKKINWFLNSGLAFDEELAYIGTFLDGSQLARSKALAPGINCVDYYSGIVYVGGDSGIWTLDGDTLDVLGIVTTSFGIISIKAVASGFLVTTVDHKIYYLTLTGTPYLIYTSTVLGLPDTLGNEWFVPDCEQSRLVVINLTTDFVVNFGNSTSNISRYVNLDPIFAPSYVAADTSQNLIFICGHDSDVVYYSNGTTPLNSIIFDNKVAWVSANNGTLIASFYLVDTIVLDVGSLQRSARVYLDDRTGPTKASIGTKPFLIKMLGRHTGVQITAPGFSNSTTIRLSNGTVFSNGDPVKPAWIQDFESSQISTWANGVREYTDVGHNDLVSISYKSFDTGNISLSIPYIVGDRHTIFLPTVSINTAAPRNFFNTKKPNLQPFSTDANSVLLLHMNGVSGGNYFQDDSISPTVYLGTGIVALTGSASKFDGSSAEFGGGYITVNANANLGFGTKDFTIEFWIKTATTGSTAKLIMPSGQLQGQWGVYLDTAGQLVWSNGVTVYTVTNNPLNTDTWRSVAISRLLLNTTIYIDGSPEASFYDNTNYTVSGSVNYLIGGGVVTYGTVNLPVSQTSSGIWASTAGTEPTFVRNVTVNFPTTGNYEFSCQIYSYGTVSLDNTVVLSIPVTTKTNVSGKVKIAVTAGNHTIGINAFRKSGVGGVKILIVDAVGGIIYNTTPGLSNLSNYIGYMDELRISTVARYTGAAFPPGVPDYAVDSPIRPTNLLNVATFELPLTRIFTPGIAALEYGNLQVNGVLYNGVAQINSYDKITVTVPFFSLQTVFAPILRVGVKEFALPINNFTQDLTETVIEITSVDTSTRVDYTGNITITDTGEYYIPNYSTAFVTSIQRNGVALTPGSYVTLASGDTIDIIGILSSPRLNDVVDVFIIGPKNYQISVQTELTYLPKYMDFGILTTTNAYSGDPLVQIGHSSVGSITDPFVRFKYRSSPITVTGIPPNTETGAVQPIQLTTDQAFMGATLIRTKANGDITQKKIITDVVNGDKIQIVKQVYNYLETGIKLQVLYIDEELTAPSLFSFSAMNSIAVTSTYDIGNWVVVQTPKTAEFTSTTVGILDNPANPLHDVSGIYLNQSPKTMDARVARQSTAEPLKFSLLSSNTLLANSLKNSRHGSSFYSSGLRLSWTILGSATSGAAAPVFALNPGASSSNFTNGFNRHSNNTFSVEPTFSIVPSNEFSVNPVFDTVFNNVFSVGPTYSTILSNAFSVEPVFGTVLNNVFSVGPRYSTILSNAFSIKPAFDTFLNNVFSVGPRYSTILSNAFSVEPVYDTFLNNAFSVEPVFKLHHYGESLVTPRYDTHHYGETLVDLHYSRHYYNINLIGSRYDRYRDTFRLTVPKYKLYHYGETLVDLHYSRHYYNIKLLSPQYDKYRTTFRLTVPKYNLFHYDVRLVIPKYTLYRHNVNLVTMKFQFHDQIDYLNTFATAIPTKTVLAINDSLDAVGTKLVTSITWENNDNLPSVGAFSTVAEARADADSKGYFKYMVQSVLNNKGVLYFTYRVDFDNEIYCNLSTPKVPLYGLMQGG